MTLQKTVILLQVLNIWDSDEYMYVIMDAHFYTFMVFLIRYILA